MVRRNAPIPAMTMPTIPLIIIPSPRIGCQPPVGVSSSIDPPMTSAAKAMELASRSRLRLKRAPRASRPGRRPRSPSARRRRTRRVSLGASLIKRSVSRASLVVFSFILAGEKCCAIRREISSRNDPMKSWSGASWPIIDSRMTKARVSRTNSPGLWTPFRLPARNSESNAFPIDTFARLVRRIS
jgi:hypothetical protein